MPTSTSDHCGVCGAAGTSIDWLDGKPVYACDDHADQERDRVARAYAAKRMDRRVDLEVGAGQRFYNCWTLDDLEGVDPVILARVRQWVAEVEKWETQQNLILFGDVGVGKSTLAYAAALATIEETKLGWARKVEWVSVRPLLAAIRASFNGGPPVDVDLGPETHLVILDDLGAERVTDWTRDWLANIVEQRYDHGRATIVTSNYSPSQLAARLGSGDVMVGQRLVSRLVDYAVVLELRGADRRKRAA